MGDPLLLLIHATGVVTGEAQRALEANGFEVRIATQLSSALGQLTTTEFAGVVMYCGTSTDDCASVDQVVAVAQDVPLLVIAATAEVARDAVRRGAQDWALSETLDGYLLARAVRASIERRRVEDSLFLERARAHVTLDSLGDAVVHTDAFGRVTGLNSTAEIVTGWSLPEAAGRPFAEVCPILTGSAHVPAGDPLALAATAFPDSPALTLVRRDGSTRRVRQAVAPVHARNGRITGAVLVLQEVPAIGTALEPQLDFLTGLPNRVLLQDRTTQAIASARRQKHQLAVLFVDLDNFKQVNDTLGHAVGDALLKAVAQRLCYSVRESDTVSRYGGDEFVVLLPAANGRQEAEVVVQKILDAIGAPYAAGSQLLHLSASVGISLFPSGGRHPEALIESADIAMYCAKYAGGCGYRLFEPGMSIPTPPEAPGPGTEGGYSGPPTQRRPDAPGPSPGPRAIG